MSEIAKRSTASSKPPSLWVALQHKARVDFLTNWRLVLLALTGLVLSIASGWTTFDGMTNFTKTPLLSGLITFGIQGVMLVTAWLIGESFATGGREEESQRKNFKPPFLETAKKSLSLLISMGVLLLGAFLLAKFVLNYDADVIQQIFSKNFLTLILALAAILGLALFLVLFSRIEIIGPYIRGVRTILGHLPLWLMFLSCMATSVFFSFDSLFSTIFPEDERRRAGELRVEGQVMAVVADVSALIERRHDQAAEQLLLSSEWQTFERQLSHLVATVESAPKMLEAQLMKNLRARQISLAKERESLSEARALRQGLTREREQVEHSLWRLKESASRQESEIGDLEDQVRATGREIALRRAEAEAEAKGVGETGHSGRGPIFRELNKKVTKLQIDREALESQLQTARAEVHRLERHRAKDRAHLIEITQQMAKLKGRERAAQEGLKVQEMLHQDEVPKEVRSTSDLKAFDRALAQFRQRPTQGALSQLQQHCGKLLRPLNEVEALKAQIADIDCEPDALNELIGPLFTLNINLADYQSQCGRSANMASGTIDALLQFGRRCIRLSGLPGHDTQIARNSINRMALDRDDKAHRFVVTWNAFSDGNRLAYLALVIAFAIDGLVFMSGLFGANVMRSPLSLSPEAGGRTISELEMIIDNSLLPDKAYAAELMLNVMSPIDDKDKSGHMAEINVQGLVLEQSLLVRKVLTAGASLGLIKEDQEKPHHYLIRSEFYHYLAAVRAAESKRGNIGNRDATPDYSAHPAENIFREEKGLQRDIANAQPEKVFPRQITSPQLEFYDQKSDRQEIFDRYLKALGMSQTTVEWLEKSHVLDAPEEWEDRLSLMGREKDQLARRVADIRTIQQQKLHQIHDQLRDRYARNPDLLSLVEGCAETFQNWLPGITLWKAYEHSRKQAEEVRAQRHQMDHIIQVANEPQRRKIDSLIGQMDEALEAKIEGWLDLEEIKNQLQNMLQDMAALSD